MNKQAPTIGRLATMIAFALSCFGLSDCVSSSELADSAEPTRCSRA